MRMRANRGSERIARLWHAITANQQVARCGVAAKRCRRPAPFQYIKTKRRIADCPAHHDMIAWSCTAAVNHPVRRDTAERGDRDHHWARRRNRVAAEQWTMEISH